MELSLQRRRMVLTVMLLVLAFLALGYRLVDLQVIRHEELAAVAEAKQRLQWWEKGQRGAMRDRNGEVLVMSLPARTIAADPVEMLGGHERVARALSQHLGMDELGLRELLTPRLVQDSHGRVRTDAFGAPITNRFVRLRRQVSEEDWQAFQERWREETFGLDSGWQREVERLRRSVFSRGKGDEIREYSNRTMAGPLLGFTGVEGQGVEGLELYLDEVLRGVDGYVQTRRSGLGGELRRMREVEMPARPGNDVYLTIDARVQRVVEEVLAKVVMQYQARGGCVVMVEPTTGRILAMASYPSYDPNQPPREPGDEARRKNWAVLHTYEPGSVFKIVAAAAALDQGVVTLSDTVDCGVNRVWRGEFGRERVKLEDVHRMKERYSTVEQVIVKSSNIGTFQMVLRLGRERYADYLLRFGFTRKTGIQLPYEESGYLLKAADRWSVLDLSRIQMGYSVAATPLQLAMAMSVVANDGKLMRPQMIDRVVTAEGRVVVQPQAEVVRQVISPETARELRKALRLVIEDGTGSLAKLDRYTVAAKTGTSKIAPYGSGRYSSSFLGFFPSESPEVCMMVLVHDPNPRLGYYGGKVAGKAFQEIAMRTVELLAIPPDVPVEPTAEETVRALADRGRAR